MKNHRTLVGGGLTTLGVMIGIAVAASWRVEHVALGTASNEFTLECDFDKFRQIMVRKDATGAVVDHAGMRVIQQKVLDIDVDARADDRPLLNAIRGRSRSTLSAEKMLVVQFNDPEIEAGELELRQLADIRPTRIHVQTQSRRPAGQVDRYVTELTAIPAGANTQVNLSTQMQIRLQIPFLFKSHADRRVQQSCERGLAQQAAALEIFIQRHADERVIVPEL